MKSLSTKASVRKIYDIIIKVKYINTEMMVINKYLNILNDNKLINYNRKYYS